MNDRLSLIQIAFAILKTNDSSNQEAHNDSLLKRYIVQLDNLNEFQKKPDPNRADDDIEWHFRDSILKCLYAEETLRKSKGSELTRFFTNFHVLIC
jgi:hypothetical protein